MAQSKSSKFLPTARYRALAGAALSALLSACVSMNIESPRPDGPVVLQNAAATCKPGDSFTQFYLLFGAAPIRTITPARMFPKSEKSYRVVEEYKWHDMVVTILAGAFLSLTKNTITVEECDAAPVFTNNSARDSYFAGLAAEQDKTNTRRLDEFAKRAGQAADVSLLLKNGRMVGGRIKSMSTDTIVVEVAAAAASTDATGTGNSSGAASDTAVTTDANAAGKTETIARGDIVKIIFNDESASGN